MRLMKRVLALAPITGTGFVVSLCAVALTAAAAGMPPRVPPDFQMPLRADNGSSVQVQVNQSHSWVNGNTLPGTTITVTLMHAGLPVDTQVQDADGNGNFFIGFYGNNANIQVNDVIDIASSIGVTASIDVIPMSGTVVTNTISGHVSAPACPANIQSDVWVMGAPGSVITTTNGACDYRIDFSPFQVEKADMVVLWYLRSDGNTVGIVRNALRVDVDLDSDGINGSTVPNAAITAQVNGATFHSTADSNGNYGLPVQGVDITTGDTITVSAGAVSVTIHAPLTLTVASNPDTNIVTGYGPPSTTMQLDVGSIKGYLFTTSITGFYQIDTNLGGGQLNYDLQPQDTGQIGTLDANHERVYINFGAVDLALSMNGYGNGEGAPGGRYIYELRPRVQQVPANDVIITDTLPVSATFVSLSSGYPYALMGNQVVITVGHMRSYEEKSVLLIVEFDAAMSAGSAHNEAVIGSPQTESNPGDNSASVDVNIVSNNTDLSVYLNPRTGDPVNGQQMIWQIDYNNNGSTGSGAVRLTDTLPISTSFVRWWADEIGWALVLTGTELAWVRDTIMGQSGNRLYLVIELDAALAPDTNLHNELRIDTSNDIDTGNNSAGNDVRVGTPRHDMQASKSFGNGATVPGKTIQYNLDFNNNGNMPASLVQVVDTLPPGTSLIQAGYGTPTGWVDVPWDEQNGNTYTWDLGTQIAGNWFSFQLQVQIDSDLTPGTVLTNYVSISSSDGDDAPWNNSASVSEVLYPGGPNLRVWKEARWNGSDEIQYTIHVENHGDVNIEGMTITDTYPVSTTLSAWFQQWNPGYANVTEDTSHSDYATFNISGLRAGDTLGIYLAVKLDPAIVDQPGLRFTNIVSASIPEGDTYTADNTFTQVSGSGPDLFARHISIDGLVRPGQVITYQVVYGNLSDQWQANGEASWLVYQLADGLTLVSATPAPDGIYGQYLLWVRGRMGNGWRNMVEVNVRVPMSVELGDSFVTTASFNDTNQASVEPDYANNTSMATAAWAITGRCYTPIVLK